MTVYLWVTFGLFAITFWALLSNLALGRFKPSTPGVTAVSAFLNAALAAWAVVLLVRG